MIFLDLLNRREKPFSGKFEMNYAGTGREDQSPVCAFASTYKKYKKYKIQNTKHKMIKY